MTDLIEYDNNVFLPRKGSFEYSFLLADKKQQKKFLKRFKFMNKYLVKPFYKMGIIPLIGLGRFLILIYTKGRKSGLERITPIEHQIIDGVIHIFVGRGNKADWFRNMKADPDDVSIKKGFKKYPVKFEIIEEKEEIVKVFKWFVTNVPILPRFVFGWRKRKDDVNTVDFSFIADKLSVIKLHKK
ncbi:MAG: nitroreductase family deazaflavin-dependent oxidoreductase [Asgard group archaeon]|nr:nitroreductase family deazaflavin-dependent oxidoreductase [Asgard group archaeon]